MNIAYERISVSIVALQNRSSVKVLIIVSSLLKKHFKDKILYFTMLRYLIYTAASSTFNYQFCTLSFCHPPFWKECPSIIVIQIFLKWILRILFWIFNFIHVFIHYLFFYNITKLCHLKFGKFFLVSIYHFFLQVSIAT